MTLLGLDAAAADAAGDGQPVVFQILEYRILGNTVLSEAEIGKAVYGFLGPNKSLSEVEQARLALEELYHARGFGTVFVDIPEQSVGTDGVVRLHVTESTLQMPRIEGADYISARQLRAAVPEATAGNVPNLPKLQAQIYAVNAASNDRTVVPVLKAGTTPGTVSLTLNVEDKLPFHGSVELNNQYTANTSPLRAQLAMSYDDMFRRLDSFSLQYQTAPQEPREVTVFAAAYQARLNASGDKLSVGYIHSDSSVATVGSINVVGKGDIYGLHYFHSLVVTQEQQSQLSIGLDYKDFTQDVELSPDDALSTPIPYTSLSASYNVTLRQSSRIWTAATSLNLGLPGLGSSHQEFADKCFECRPNFVTLRADGALSQKLPADFSVLLQAGGQYSVDPVISNEQYVIGGVRTVRGYLEGEALGDIGWRGSVEFRAPNYLPSAMHVIAIPVTFFDYAQVRFQAPLPGQPASYVLRSWGAGLQLRAFNLIDGTLTWAQPLTDGTLTVRGDARWEFVVRTTW